MGPDLSFLKQHINKSAYFKSIWFNRFAIGWLKSCSGSTGLARLLKESKQKMQTIVKSKFKNTAFGEMRCNRKTER